LLLRSFAKLVSVDLGYDAANVLTVEVEPLDQSAALRRQYYASLVGALRLLPEVASAGAIDHLGLTGGGSYGFAKADNGADVQGFQRSVLPGYFEAIGVRPLAGRLFDDADRATGDAIIVNAAASHQHFDGNAVGHTLRTGNTLQRYWRIVGVVPNIRHFGPEAHVEPEMYVLPDSRAPEATSMPLAIVLRLRDGTSLPVDRLKLAAESLGPRVLVGQTRAAEALVSEQVARPRDRMLLLTMLGVFGLLLTVVGIFSMTAYAVARRTREIGVRVAFGARPAQVVGVMVRDAVWPVVFGLAAGLAGTYYATRVISSFLFETPPHDPTTLVVVVALLGLAASLAAWLPARRAALVDPVSALRAE
jgi:putative ABC transport system permease protein